MVEVYHRIWYASAAVVGYGLYAVALPAWVAHEMTHYLAALLAGKRPALQLRPFPACQYDWPAPRYVQFAPSVVGCVFWTVYTLLSGLPELTPLTALGLLWWVVYTYPSASDRHPEPAATP